MFYIRHPKQVGDQRAVAMQVVQQKQALLQDLHVLVVDRPASVVAALLALAPALPATKAD